jgi:chromosome segregation ATPase
MREEGEAELAAESTHVSTRSMRKAAPPKEESLGSATNVGYVRTEEMTDEEESPAIEAPRAKKRKAGGSPEIPADLAEEMKASTTADIGAELIRRASEVSKVAETSRNLKFTHAKTLKEAARSIAAGATEMAKRADPASGAIAIMEGRIAALEAENEALRKELASRTTAEKSSETARLDTIEREMKDLPSLVQRMEERLQNVERRVGKEVVSDETRRVEPGTSNTPVTKGGQATAVEW